MNICSTIDNNFNIIKCNKQIYDCYTVCRKCFKSLRYILYETAYIDIDIDISKNTCEPIWMIDDDKRYIHFKYIYNKKIE